MADAILTNMINPTNGQGTLPTGEIYPDQHNVLRRFDINMGILAFTDHLWRALFKHITQPVFVVYWGIPMPTTGQIFAAPFIWG